LKIFAIDTSTDRIVLGYKDENKDAEYSFKSRLRHSKTLMVKIDAFLKELDVDVEEIDLLGCGIGPGSFTGLRIGIAAVKAMSYAKNCKIVGIPSLDLYAFNVPYNGYILVLKHARENYFYGALYSRNDDSLELIIPHFFKNKEEITEELKSLKARNMELEEIFTIGDGVNLMDDMRGTFEVHKGLEQYNEIRGLFLVKEVERRYKLNENVFDSKSLLPLYIQRPIAEINWEKKHHGGM